MKRLQNLVFLVLACCICHTAFAVDIWVATNGNDKNIGTQNQPLASIAAALRKARDLRRLNDASVKDGIHIIVRGGTYQLYEPISIRTEDAGTQTSPTIIEAAPNEQPIISGGVTISNWQQVKENITGLPKLVQGKIWSADVSKLGFSHFNFRQLWVNNQKAIRARSTDIDSLQRILSWNYQAENCWIPTPKNIDLTKVVGAEMFIHQWWEIAILRIKSIEVKADSAKLSFMQPESKIQSQHPWPAPWMSKETGNSAFYLTNAIQFLNKPGEWFLDTKLQKIYYYPKPNENLNAATITAALLETLVNIEGSIDNTVKHISFKGLKFQHTGFMRPSLAGHVPHQEGMYMLEAYKLKPAGTPTRKTLDNQAWIGRPSAAVRVNFANNIAFTNCNFLHLASTGLDIVKGGKNIQVVGNLFKDIGGTAVQIGMFSEPSHEIHLPYNPKDTSEITSNITVSNNLITNATNEDWGCVGIGIGYAKNTTVTHNDICEVNYSGISLGWGWTDADNAAKNNHLEANKIHHYGKQMYDCGGIYTQSSQPNSSIEFNYIDSIYKAPYAHLPSHWFYLYTDEGTSGFTVKNNWTPSTKYLQNANGANNIWYNNGPNVTSIVKQSAGLEKDYQYLLENQVSVDKHFGINKEQAVIIELISNDTSKLNSALLNEVLNKFNINQSALFQWQNHTVIFDKIQDVYSVTEKLKAVFPTITVKTYNNLFYEFNRSRCADGTTAKEWSHIILTANLVKDKQKQQAYLNYHATQFEKWPELSKGFCNASFQQLLLFKNDRQLMLVISIPKGESLDKLNPKTAENNSRVHDWNNIMKQYQEGILGTKPGETWVFLQPLANLPQ
ncbi:MAG: right-handed parallel beta-helix repeat-containing protein [Flavobacterium sp.]|nr:right-handed parallel beta-helix repeat-containing protein [Flavobacterium sp.]